MPHTGLSSHLQQHNDLSLLLPGGRNAFTAFLNTKPARYAALLSNEWVLCANVWVIIGYC